MNTLISKQMELNRIKGKIAFISGASSGIGKAVAEKLAQMGVNLILCARRAEVLAELKAKLEKEHAVEVITLAFDVRNYQEVAKKYPVLTRKMATNRYTHQQCGLGNRIATPLYLRHRRYRPDD